ncbi:hypothetical protein LZ554_007229 [Drepanopeziza brunnea f. sp. 'monogermtubi']|nr:hypothetical protein LZ554_007229 [Drepanopeziza brunnea f. sp. 'monogermtubi']
MPWVFRLCSRAPDLPVLKFDTSPSEPPFTGDICLGYAPGLNELVADAIGLGLPVAGTADAAASAGFSSPQNTRVNPQTMLKVARIPQTPTKYKKAHLSYSSTGSLTGRSFADAVSKVEVVLDASIMATTTHKPKPNDKNNVGAEAMMGPRPAAKTSAHTTQQDWNRNLHRSSGGSGRFMDE